SISYTGDNPQKVMQVANTLASYFMDENLKVREAQAMGTSDFLESELEKTRKRLEGREQTLSAYKVKYLGGLPSELNSNLSTLDRLEKKHAARNAILREAKKSLTILETQIAETKEMASQTSDDPFGGFAFEEESFAGSENENKLSHVRKQHDNLLLKYTEKHPDVAKLKKIIEKLEKIVEEETKEKIPEDDSQDMGMIDDFAARQQEMQEMQLTQIKNEIKKTQSDIFRIENQMKAYQKRVDDTPKRALEMQSLKRDYSNIRGVFNSLLNRKLEAELSVNMEKKQKGEQFRILDHARLPQKPISPNVKNFFTLSVITGLGIGGGILVLWELLCFSIIRREDQIEKELGLTILATIPRLAKPYDKIKQRIAWIAFLGFTLYALVFLAFFAILNSKGLDRTINFIKMNLNI
ncbi:MAG: protein GumC, partial [Desulfobacula sp.]|nr:protein GumC [Desulfobacula sp.]